MAKLRMSPIALSHIIQTDGHLETIFHLTCRDRNLIGLQPSSSARRHWV